MTRRNQRGVTLVELLIGVSIVVVLALAAAQLYSLSVKLLIKNQLTEQLQREGDAVLAHMSQTMKPAVGYNAGASNLATNPNSLTFSLSTNQTRRYYVTASTLHYIDEATTDSTLLAPGTTITTLTFQPNVTDTGALTAVRVQAALSRTRSGQTVTLSIGSTIATRPQ